MNLKYSLLLSFIQINLWLSKKKNPLIWHVLPLWLTKFVHSNPRKMVAVTLKLWRDCSIEHFKQQLKKKKKKELPFWSPQGIIKIFWMGMMVELSKMRQYPRNSGKTGVSNHLYGRDNEMGEKREELKF